MLRGLGYTGRVPSPTYTLLEQYACDGLSVVHLDLYRLRGGDELENLGLRDWLEESCRWIAVEWPERAPQLAERCDLMLELAIPAPGRRRLTVTAASRAGTEALRSVRHAVFNNGT
jgi:tRNA threonylcarbamoyladenosine biosynthesis protein TsaE